MFCASRRRGVAQSSSETACDILCVVVAMHRALRAGRRGRGRQGGKVWPSSGRRLAVVWPSSGRRLAVVCLRGSFDMRRCSADTI